MPNQNEKTNPVRELPKSLLGIETILFFLNEKNRESSSIRNISEHTGLSMRVTKNILLQLESFNQIERVVEKNNILPKWRITKFGKKVLKEAEGTKKKIEFPSRENGLLSNILIPDKIETLKTKIKENIENNISKLKSMQNDLSKTLGAVLNLNSPIFEDLMSAIINRIKSIRNQITNFPSDPYAVYQLKKKGEKQKKYSKEEIENLLIEIYFVDSVLNNELNYMNNYNIILSQCLENEEISKGYSTAKDLREEIRIIFNLIRKRESIKINSHVISPENLKLVSKNRITQEIINTITESPIDEKEQAKGIKDIIISLIAKLNTGEKHFEGSNVDLTENIPLYAFYQLILDENPNFNITIKQLEEIINSLAEEGYLPGIKVIQEDEDHYLKLVQFKVRDITKNELKLISSALKFQSFTLADMVGATGWSTNQVVKILNHLTEFGILKHSKNHLHGDRWYIVSENII
ncbi:hypothetical protein LCGC14_1234920 [marine sediment metagenome]|uniref:Uncharacterized protein n=1 Tax=marine sediment metagenome TaxID=412755 RepID=A0A0F9L7D3_9ZZZZ